MFSKIRKIWSKFVGPWEAYKHEREGWRVKYVFARKFFGFKQYMKDARSTYELGGYKVRSTTFFIKDAYEFSEFSVFEKSILADINNTQKPTVKVTKVETE